jgi:hypothetical protein
MPQNVVFNGTTYAIPLVGELAWSGLSNFLIDVGTNAAITQEADQAIRVALTTPVTVAAATDYAVVTDLTVAGAVAVNLPAGVDGQIFVIVDGKGDAGTNNITITPAAGTIAGAATLVLTHNRQTVMLQYHTGTTDWKVLANTLYPGTITTSDISGAIAIAQGGTGQTTQTAAFDALAPTTTKGDLIASNGTDNIRVAVGTDGFALVADSSQAAGVKYAAVVTNPMDSAGDMIYGGVAGVATKLDSGTAEQWLKSGGAGAPAWSNTVTTGKTIDGTADEVQLTVQGHSTQTNDILLVEKSDGTDLLNVTNTAGTKIRGTTTNDAAAAGFVGEYLTESRVRSSATSLTTNTSVNVTTANITLTAGDWDVGGVVGFDAGATTSMTNVIAAISLTSATVPGTDVINVPTSNELRVQYSQSAGVTYTVGHVVIPPFRISVSSSTTIYLVAQSAFTVSTMSTYGSYWARRAR